MTKARFPLYIPRAETALLPSFDPMKTARSLLSAGLLLATASAGLGQQPAAAANNAVRVAANVSTAPTAVAPPVVQGPPREYVLLTGDPR